MRLKELQKIWIIFPILAVDLFFVISGILGYNYEGSESSNIYSVYNIIIFCLVLLYYFKSILKKPISFLEIKILSIPFIVFGLYLFYFMIQFGINSYNTQQFLFFNLWGVSGILIAIIIWKNNYLEYLTKYMELVMIIFTLGLLISNMIPFLVGDYSSRDGIGGATYQNVSYMSAFAYGLNLYYIFYFPNARLSFTKSKTYKFLQFIFIPLQLVMIFLSGGRGGMVLAAIYTLYIFVNRLFSLERKTLKKIGVYMLISIPIFIIAFPFLMQNDIFSNGVDRVFAFLSPSGGINWEGTSGRNDVYLDSLYIIKDNILFGQGFFGNSLTHYPHNLFLQLLEQGGLIYLFIAIIIISYLLITFFKKVKKDKNTVIIKIVAFYPLVLLMFSGSYLTNGLFWFSLVAMYLYSKKSNKI